MMHDCDPITARSAGRVVVRALGLPKPGTDDFADASDIMEMLGLKPYTARARSTKAGEP